MDAFWFGDHLPEETPVWAGDASTLTPAHMEDFDKVVFLGGLSNDPMADFSPARNFAENAALPVALCRMARDAGVKQFILASSCSIYGRTDEGEVSEFHPVRPQSSYGIAKRMAEVGCLALISERFAVVTLRKGTVCGPSPRMRFDLVINAMVRDALCKGQITVHDPEAWRPILAIDDAVQAYTAVIDGPPVLSGTFNVTSANVQVGAIADTVAKVCGINNIVVKNQRDNRSYRVRIDRFKSSYPFDTDPTTAVTRTALAVREHIEHNMKGINLYDPVFTNIAVFKQQIPGVPEPEGVKESAA